jgi:hypothetical protein
MDAYLMMKTAAILFGIAALGGITMAGMRLAGTAFPPTWMAMVHGLVAAAGLTLLLYAALMVGVPAMAQLAAGLFVLAAIGGATMNLAFHWKQQPLPIPLMLGHAGLAVAAFVLLLLSLRATP